MTVAEMTRKMIVSSNGNRHDINHFMKVYAFAKTIGESQYSRENVENTLERVFRTETGRTLLRSMYL